MKLIVNRGFENLLTRVVVYKNGQAISGTPFESDCCTFNAQEGDTVVVRLRALSRLGVWTVASFVCQQGTDTYLLSPTRLCRVWELVNYRVLPWLFIILLIPNIVVPGSELYNTFAIGVLVLLVLSLLAFYACATMPSMRQRFYKLASW